MNEIEVRMANVEDASLIAEMSRKTFYDTFAAYNSKEDIDQFLNRQFTFDALKMEVGAPGNIFLLAYQNAVPLGYARMRNGNTPPELAGSNVMEIARIYAIKDAIGKGVGKALMNECINISKNLDKEIIWLGVWEKNDRAIAFYQSWGFQVFAQHPFILGSDIQTDHLMKKHLQ